MAKRRFDAAATLGGLLGPTGAAELTSPDQLRQIAVADLFPTPHQPRSAFPDDSLTALAESIRQNGVLQPLLARVTERGYEIVAGERRWRAAKLAQLEAVPVYVRELDDAQAAAASAVENLMREDLNPIEEVEAKRRMAALALGVPDAEVMARLRRLLDHPEEDLGGVRQLDETFARLGGEKWQSFVRNKGRVLNLPQDVKAAIQAGLDYRKALLIGAAADPLERAELLRRASEGATVQALREVMRPTQPEGERRRHEVVRALGQRRALERLSAKQRARLDKLLAELHRMLTAVED